MLTLNEHNMVIPNAETLIIPAFKDIWDNDKSKDKVTALKTLTYIYFKHDIKSKYRNSYFDKELEDALKRDLFGNKDYKFDKDISNAESVYSELQTSKSLKLLLAAEKAMEQVTRYFDGFDLDEVNAEDRPDVIAKLMKNIKEVDEVSSRVETARKKIEEDLLAKSLSSKRKLSKWEIPK